MIQTRVIVFSPRRGPSHKSRWDQQVDNKTYNSLRGMTIDSLVRGSDSSSGGPADGTDGMQACLYRGRTHFGQKRLPQIEQQCQKPGFPPPQQEPRHLALLEFFIARERQRYWAPVCLNRISRGKRKRERERVGGNGSPDDRIQVWYPGLSDNQMIRMKKRMRIRNGT